MEKSLMQRIDDLHEARECKGALGRVRCAAKLLFFYAAFAFHRSYLLLTHDPSKSFQELHKIGQDGLWQASYADHLRYRIRMRVYAFGTVISVVASLALTLGLVQLNDSNTTTYALTIIDIQETDDTDGELEFDETETLSPSPASEEPATDEEIEDGSTVSSGGSFSSAAVFSVTATNDLSVTTNIPNIPGSLNTALNTANSSAANDLNIITFTTAGTYSFNVGQAIVRRVHFVNESGGRVIINGSALGVGQSCLSFESGADNSEIGGIEFQDCPIGITLENVSGVTVGGDSTETLFFAGGTQAIDVQSTASNVNIQNVVIGEDSIGTTDTLAGIAITLAGDNNSIANSTIGNADLGISITGDDNTVTSSFIGVSSGGDDIGNTTNGITVTGDANTIGGSDSADENVIGNNGANGVMVTNTASTTVLEGNTIGLDSSDNAAGNTEAGISLILGAADTATLSGNRIAYSGTDGIALDGGASVNINNNSVFENVESGLYMSGAGTAHSITQNSFGVFVASDDSESAGGNGEDGIEILDGVNAVTVGGTGDGNTISYNTEHGVSIDGANSEGNLVSQNDFTDNALGEIGLSAGANDGISAPEVSSASAELIVGTDGISGGAVEAYADGQYVGRTTDIASDGSWSITISENASLSATATTDVIGKEVAAVNIDSGSNTSEFSASVTGINSDDTFVISTSVDTATTSADIAVTSDEAATVTLTHGTGPNKLTTTKNSTTLKKNHSFTLNALSPNTTYYYKVEATNATNETVTSTVRSFTTASNAPMVTSLNGDFSVVTQPETLAFEGSVNGSTQSHFRFEDALTGETIAVCETDSDHVCTLPFTLAIGEYDIYFDSATKKGVTKETSGAHRLVVSPPVVTTVLTADNRAADYFTRVVQDDTVTLVGLQPDRSDVAVTVNGVAIDRDKITATGDNSFSATIDLSTLTRGQDYLIEVDFTNKKSGAPLGGSLYYPFKYAHYVVEPIVTGIGPSYALGETARATVNAGARNILVVTDNGLPHFTTTLSQTADTVLGDATFFLPTGSVGSHTVTIQTTDSIGLSSNLQSYTYTVYGAATTNNSNTITPTEEGIEGVAEEPEEGEEGEEETPDEETPDEEVVEPVDPTVDVTDPVEKERLKRKLNALLRSTLKIQARSLTLDADGNVLEEKDASTNAEGAVVLRSKSVVGLKPSTWFEFGSQSQMDVLQISGISEPFATVTVTIFSDPIVQITEADKEGAWKINVAVSDLPEGQHTAFLKTESRGVESDEVEIARFVVIQEQQLSNTSWILIGNILVVLIIVSIMITIRIQHFREEKRLKAIRVNRKPITRADLLTEIQKKQKSQKDDDDDDDLHNALGV